MNIIEQYMISFISKMRYKKKCVIEKNAIIYGKCDFEGKNKIGPGSHVTFTSMGYASYIGKNSVFSHAKIGRFCSIGDEVKLIRATHPTDEFVSTHPAFYSTNTLCSFVSEDKYEDIIENDEGYSILIGNDVWIGNNVLLKAGITIGNGAVVAMGSIVTKDVPDYSIVGGVPAHVIRYRFNDSIRQKLIQTRWWNRDIRWIKNNANAFRNAEELLELL